MIGNKYATWEMIIKEFGDEHLQTGKPIIYTSNDSVVQITAHEDIIPVPKQYSICETARKTLVDEWAVGRVIARPFIGASGKFARTQRRKDFSLEPTCL